MALFQDGEIWLGDTALRLRRQAVVRHAERRMNWL